MSKYNIFFFQLIVKWTPINGNQYDLLIETKGFSNMTFKSKFIHDLTQGKVNFGASLKGISVLRYFFFSNLEKFGDF